MAHLERDRFRCLLRCLPPIHPLCSLFVALRSHPHLHKKRVNKCRLDQKRFATLDPFPVFRKVPPGSIFEPRGSSFRNETRHARTALFSLFLFAFQQKKQTEGRNEKPHCQSAGHHIKKVNPLAKPRVEFARVHVRRCGWLPTGRGFGLCRARVGTPSEQEREKKDTYERKDYTCR